jgi:hypothetical protein
MWFCLFLLLVTSNDTCHRNNVFGLDGGNTMIADALNLITMGSNFGTLAGPNDVGFTSMGSSQLSGFLSSTISGNTQVCKMEQMKNWVIDNFLSLEEWDKWKVDHGVNMDNMFNDFELVDFLVDKDFFRNADHIDPKTSDPGWISNNYLALARSSLKGITSAVTNICNRSKKFVKSNNNKEKSALVSNMLLMAELIVEGNLLIMQMHQVTEGCKDRCGKDMGKQVLRDIFDWEDFLWRVEHEFIHMEENLMKWKKELRHYRYAQDSEVNEQVFKNQNKGYETRCRRFERKSWRCKFTVKIKEGDWTCWYHDNSFGTDEFLHGGVFEAEETEYNEFGYCHSDNSFIAERICSSKEGATEDHFDDDICNKDTDNWPKHDAAEMQAWRLGQSLWKLRMETFAHLANRKFTNYWTMPFQSDFAWEAYAAPVKFQWSADVVHNMACEICNSYDPKFPKCKQRCKKDEKWILNRRIGDDDARWYSGFRSHLLNMDLCPHNKKRFFSMCVGNRRKLKKMDAAVKPKGNKHSPKGRKHLKDKKINSGVMNYMGHKIERLKSELKQLEDQKEEEFAFSDEMNKIEDNRRKL